jgi:hypothetical protein
MFLEYLRKLKKETTEHSSWSLIHILSFSISWKKTSIPTPRLWKHRVILMCQQCNIMESSSDCSNMNIITCLW